MNDGFGIGPQRYFILSGEDGAVCVHKPSGMAMGPLFDDAEDARGFLTWLDDHYGKTPKSVRDHEWPKIRRQWKTERAWPMCDECGQLRAEPPHATCEVCRDDADFQSEAPSS